jgi:hypothetical protein
VDCDHQHAPCSAELISTAYQPWNSVFLSQQISHSRLISQKKQPAEQGHDLFNADGLTSCPEVTVACFVLQILNPGVTRPVVFRGGGSTLPRVISRDGSFMSKFLKISSVRNSIYISFHPINLILLS